MPPVKLPLDEPDLRKAGPLTPIQMGFVGGSIPREHQAAVFEELWIDAPLLDFVHRLAVNHRIDALAVDSEQSLIEAG